MDPKLLEEPAGVTNMRTSCISGVIYAIAASQNTPAPPGKPLMPIQPLHTRRFLWAFLRI